MDISNNLIFVKGIESTEKIKSCTYENGKYKIVFKGNSEIYNYGFNNVVWFNNPETIGLDSYKFINKDGVEFFNIKKILKFKDDYKCYFRFFYNNDSSHYYNSNDLKIIQNALNSQKVTSHFDYFKQISEIVSLKTDDGKNILKGKYEKLNFIDNSTVLSNYLKNDKINHSNARNYNGIIFPFGCNSSQLKAVNSALTNKISIIEGPPGTGKTQTILNIIANIIISGKTVAVVSNNNSATDNVYEKFQKYGFAYIAAQLGSSNNKKNFIIDKQTSLPSFNKTASFDDLNKCISSINSIEQDIISKLDIQNEIAQFKQELSALTVERTYFEEYYKETYDASLKTRNTSKLNSQKIMDLWISCQESEKNKVGLWFKIKSVLFYGIADFNFYKKTLEEIVSSLQKLYYEIKYSEIVSKIEYLQKQLDYFHFNEKINELNSKSCVAFEMYLSIKYGNKIRTNFTEDDLYKNAKLFINEYPVILSTTHSINSSLNGIIYDYIIVDEASQVDLATGVLTMSCAENIVVVGDLMQLPNVITDKDKAKIVPISQANCIEDCYAYENNSLLSSVCKVFSSAPRTLLREHYRCHPKIIDFCNKKFYNNQLIIMTRDNGESDVLKVYKTVSGNHARDKFNVRQIDEIKQTIIPELQGQKDKIDVGIIAPYNAQTNRLSDEIGTDLDIFTVHKFQGREKNDIIISTVDNEITEFTDNPNLLNVAVSRAKNRLRLVVSNNENNINTNIGDLMKYIEYNNFEILQCEIYSVFDMLYKGYSDRRKTFLNKHKYISQYDSENLMYAIIEDVLNFDKFSKCDVVNNYPLNALIHNPEKLNDEETLYAMNIKTHVDFLIYNKVDKSPVLTIEVDGYAFHKVDSDQAKRDKMKNAILQKYNIPLIRFSTTGSQEKEKLVDKLTEVLFNAR